MKMAKKHEKKIKGWHNPPKYILNKTYGKCKICKKTVKNLEEHIKKVHRGVK